MLPAAATAGKGPSGGREGGGAEEREGLRGRAEEREGELRSLIGREDSGREEGHGETV